MFDGVVVAVLENPSKAPLFTVGERMALLEEALRDQPNVRVGAFGGLLVDYARRKKAASSAGFDGARWRLFHLSATRLSM